MKARGDGALAHAESEGAFAVSLAEPVLADVRAALPCARWFALLRLLRLAP